MTNPKDMDREEFIVLLACGELDRTAPGVAERLAADPALALEVEEMCAIARVVDSSNDLRTEALRAAESQTDDEAAIVEGFWQQVRESADRSIEADRGALAPGLSPFARLAAAILILIGGGLAVQFFMKEDPAIPPTGTGAPSNVELGNDTMVAPQAFTFGTLEWNPEAENALPPRIDVRAYAVTGSEQGLEEVMIHESAEVMSWPLVLDPALLEGVDRLLFEVDVTHSGDFRPTTHRVSQER